MAACSTCSAPARSTRATTRAERRPSRRAPGAQRGQWRGFALPSFLTGNKGHAYYESSAATKLICTDNSPFFFFDIAAPTETYASVASYLHGGVYIRHFSSGVAIVNTSTS